MDRVNPKLLDLSEEEQQKIIDSFQNDLYLTKRHCALVHFIENKSNPHRSYLPIDNPNYLAPSKAEFSDVVKYLAKVHSLSAVSRMLGIYKENDANKTINRWMNGDTAIPYTAWRLLLILSGRAIEVNRIIESDGSKPWEHNW